MAHQRVVDECDQYRADVLFAGPVYTLWRILCRPEFVTVKPNCRNDAFRLKHDMDEYRREWWRTKDMPRLKWLTGELLVIDDFFETNRLIDVGP